MTSLARDITHGHRPGPPAATEGRPPDSAPIRIATGVLAAVMPFCNGAPVIVGQVWSVAVVGALVLARMSGRSRRVGGRSCFVAAATGAVLGAVASIGVAVHVTPHVWSAVELVVAWVVAPGVLAAASGPLRRTAIAGFVAGQTVSSVAALLQATTDITALHQTMFDGRATGLAGHPIILALQAGVAAFCCLPGLRRRPRATVPVLVVNLLAVLLSGSLTALSALLTALVVYAVARRTRTRDVLVVAAAIAVTIGLFDSCSAAFGIHNIPTRILQTTGRTSDESSIEVRLLTVDYAWREIRRDYLWVGVGLDDVSGATYDGITVTHNIIVRSWYQGGVVLLVSMLLVYALLVRGVWRAVRHGDHAAPAAVVTLLIAMSMTNTAFTQLSFWIPLIGAWSVSEVRVATRR